MRPASPPKDVYDPGLEVLTAGRSMLDLLMIAKMCLGEMVSAKLGARLQRYRDILNSDSGAVTVEWVALAAGLVIGCVMISFILMNGLYIAAGKVSSQLSP